MANLTQIQHNIDEGIALKLVAQTFTEIAAIRLKRIRSGIENNRNFVDNISSLFHTVKSVAVKRKNISETAQKVIHKNGLTQSVLITSNYRFYGDINKQLIEQFMLSTGNLATARIVIGKVGVEYLKASNYSHPFYAVILKTDIPTETEIADLVAKIKDYQQVLIFHSKFKTALTQIPAISDITQTAQKTTRLGEYDTTPPGSFVPGLKSLLSPTPRLKDEAPLDFILEPEIEKMLTFFDNQIITLLLEATFLEAELSRTAARLISMDQAQSNADGFLKQQRIQLSVARHSIDNERIIETYANLLGLRQYANW